MTLQEAFFKLMYEKFNPDPEKAKFLLGYQFVQIDGTFTVKIDDPDKLYGVKVVKYIPTSYVLEGSVRQPNKTSRLERGGFTLDFILSLDDDYTSNFNLIESIRQSLVNDVGTISVDGQTLNYLLNPMDLVEGNILTFNSKKHKGFNMGISFSISDGLIGEQTIISIREFTELPGSEVELLKLSSSFAWSVNTLGAQEIDKDRTTFLNGGSVSEITLSIIAAPSAFVTYLNDVVIGLADNDKIFNLRINKAGTIYDRVVLVESASTSISVSDFDTFEIVFKQPDPLILKLVSDVSPREIPKTLTQAQYNEMERVMKKQLAQLKDKVIVDAQG